jgi:hypothetical protein
MRPYSIDRRRRGCGFVRFAGNIGQRFGGPQADRAHAMRPYSGFLGHLKVRFWAHFALHLAQFLAQFLAQNPHFLRRFRVF